MGYNEMFLLDADRNEFYEKDRKRELSQLEKIGLEAVLADFVKDYEEETEGDFYTKDIKNYIRWNADSVDILDGYSDTYIFNHYAISEVWVTKNGCIMLSAVDLEQYTGDDVEHYNELKEDLFNLPRHFDLWCDFESVLFRLN